MPHNVVTKKYQNVHTCTITVRYPDGDRSSLFLYLIWLWRKYNNQFLVEKKLGEEIIYLCEMGMDVYHPLLKQIVHIKTKFYIFLCDQPNKSSALSIICSYNCSQFVYTGELDNVIDNVVCCEGCYKEFSQNRNKQYNQCHSFDSDKIHYQPNELDYPSDFQ